MLQMRTLLNCKITFSLVLSSQSQLAYKVKANNSPTSPRLSTSPLVSNRTILYKAEQLQLLNDSQWGSRPHRQTKDALMLKELSYDLACLTKTSLATFDNDAQGCYDRVPCTLAMLARVQGTRS